MLNRTLLAVGFCLLAFGASAKSNVTYHSPVDYKITLAGNFGEPRPNHFHGGLDIKTDNVEGKHIYSIGDGYVSRLTVGISGFGNAVYVTHPEGYTSIYCHLQRFSPKLERMVSGIVKKDAKTPMPHWQDSVLSVIEKHIGRCPDSFTYQGKNYTPMAFSKSLGLNLDDYVSLTSYTHHPFNKWFVIEAPYKWRLKPSYNIPIQQLMEVLDMALDAGYTVAWGGDVTGDFTRTGLAMLPDGILPTQQMRQEQWDDWRFTYDHVMVIYGKAVDEQGKPFYMVKNSWGKTGQYKGVWYMSRDYMALNTTYLFLNRHALPANLQEAVSGNPF